MLIKIFHSNNDIFYLALEEILNQISNINFQYDFVIFAISPKYDPIYVNPTIQKIFKTKNYLAFNAIHAFSNINIEEGIVALFIKFEKNGKIKIKEEVTDSKNLNMMFVPFSEGECICDITTKMNKPIIGGVCSGEQAYIYYNGKIEKEKPVILEFENIEYEFGISLGYHPIGPTYRVTLAKKNKLYVIDYEDASILSRNLLKNTDGDIKNLWYSPLLIISDTSGYVDVVRTFKHIEENQYVEFFGKIPRHSLVKLSFGNKNMLIEEDEKTAKKIKEKIMPELVFNFSCVARQYILENLAKEENIIYSKVLNAPVFGFFTYGEIGPNYNFTSTKLYNQSSLVVAIKEK